jgi:DUF2924 family protein
MKKQTTSKQAGRSGKTKKDAAPARAAKAPRTRERDPRLPAAGTTLSRTYKNKEYLVTVLDAGFRYDGQEFRSLTALAREITGYPAISGPAFFGIAGPRATAAETPAAPPKKRAPKRAPNIRRAGRDSQSVEAVESGPTAGTATA